MPIVGHGRDFGQLPDDLAPDATAVDNDNLNQFTHVFGDLDASTAWILVDDDGAQAEAAALCEPTGVAVFALSTLSFFGGDRPDGLDMIDGKDVLCFPFGDAATSHMIYELAASYGTICEEEGADSVRFVWFGPQLDAHLDGRPLDDRKKRIKSIVKRTGIKPAKQKPKGPTAAQKKVTDELAGVERKAKAEGRPVIDVNGDRQEVLDKLVEALKSGVDGDRLYDFGGKLAHITTDESGATIAELVDDGKLLNLIANSARTVSVTTKGVNAAWPETKTLTALFSRHADFRPLKRIAPSPIVREDNSIATEDGYDEASQVLLDLKGIEIDVPDDPTEDDVAAAVELLLDRWLGDFPFLNRASKANMLALILSFPLRALVSLIPLAYILAKSQGTGKSKLMSLVVLLFTGVMPDLDSLPEDEGEIRKQITTLLSLAPSFICFDESPRIGGKSINRFLTAQRWSDRLLGGNIRAALPCEAITIATANNGQAVGDTRRRYFPIELFFEGENPENRPESSFEQADIEAWTLANRGELLSAVFTLIRAWQGAGRPKRATPFGSFERWESVVGGVIANAGVEGFLDNLGEHRKSADYDEGLWVAHLEWLDRTFPKGFFSTRQVIEAMIHGSGRQRRVESDADLPPGIDTSPLDPNYAASLGRLYNARHVKWLLEKSQDRLDREAAVAAAEQAEQVERDQRADEAGIHRYEG